MIPDNSAVSRNDLNQDLLTIAVSLNDQLENEVNNATNRAFNLGCFVGLIPLTLLVFLTYIVTGSSWVGAIVILIMGILGLILFANVTASIARRNTLNRVYQQIIEPEITKTLNENHLDRTEFYRTASETLPPDAPLCQFLTIGDLDPMPDANSSSAGNE